MLIRLRYIVNALDETVARFALCRLVSENRSTERSPFHNRYVSIGDRQCLPMKPLKSRRELSNAVQF
jgi:hypothetical protein